MVGVPGRSKACVTCLKRKKRCDLAKPTCGTCIKARVECGGYHRPRIFINNTIDNQNQTALTRSKKTKRNDDSSNSSSNSSDCEVALPPTLARTAYQARYMDLFWRMYLPNGQALSIELKQIALGRWIDAIFDLHATESVLQKALLGMSLTAVARQDKNESLREEGRRMYTSSLQGLTAALKDPKRATSDAILTAIRLLSFYESLFGRNEGDIKQIRAWQAHNAGDIALISARSPYSFISGYAHDLFADGRSNLAMSFLRQRKRCFLSDPEWKTIPWLHHEKNPRDHLFDTILDLATQFEDLDSMQTRTDPFERELSRQLVLDGFLQLHQELITWQLIHAPDFHPLDSIPDDLLAHHIAGAHLMTTFWATVIVVCSNIQALLQPALDCEFEFDPVFDLDTCCANMIRTFPIFVHPALGLFRAHVTTYPVTVAIHYICAAGPRRLVEERRILADCLYDPALAGVRQFISNMKEEAPEEFLN